MEGTIVLGQIVATFAYGSVAFFIIMFIIICTIDKVFGSGFEFLDAVKSAALATLAAAVGIAILLGACFAVADVWGLT